MKRLIAIVLGLISPAIGVHLSPGWAFLFFLVAAYAVVILGLSD